jgi:hypothetical protein
MFYKHVSFINEQNTPRRKVQMSSQNQKETHIQSSNADLL